MQQLPCRLLISALFLVYSRAKSACPCGPGSTLGPYSYYTSGNTWFDNASDRSANLINYLNFNDRTFECPVLAGIPGTPVCSSSGEEKVGNVPLSLLDGTAVCPAIDRATLIKNTTPRCMVYGSLPPSASILCLDYSNPPRQAKCRYFDLPDDGNYYPNALATPEVGRDALFIAYQNITQAYSMEEAQGYCPEQYAPIGFTVEANLTGAVCLNDQEHQETEDRGSVLSSAMYFDINEQQTGFYVNGVAGRYYFSDPNGQTPIQCTGTVKCYYKLTGEQWLALLENNL